MGICPDEPAILVPLPDVNRKRHLHGSSTEIPTVGVPYGELQRPFVLAFRVFRLGLEAIALN